MLAEARESWAAIRAAEKQAVGDKVKAMPSEDLAEFCRSNGIKWLAACDANVGSELGEIDWDEMAGMRHHLVHNFHGIDKDKVWNTVADDIPFLIAQFQAALAQHHG